MIMRCSIHGIELKPERVEKRTTWYSCTECVQNQLEIDDEKADQKGWDAFRDAYSWRGDK